MSYAGLGYFSSFRTIKCLQSVNTFHVKVIPIFGVTVDTAFSAHWRNRNFKFRIADDTFNGNCLNFTQSLDVNHGIACQLLQSGFGQFLASLSHSLFIQCPTTQRHVIFFKD